MARSRKTRCKRGHDLTKPENVYEYVVNGTVINRQCRMCNKIRSDSARARGVPAKELRRRKKISETKQKTFWDGRRAAAARYKPITDRVAVGDIVHDIECTFSHKNKGTVVGVSAQYGTARVRVFASGDTVSIYAGNLRVLRSSCAAS